MKLLLTGFEPFNEWAVNSSWEGAKIAADALGTDCEAICLPVDYVDAHDAIIDILSIVRPHVCLLTGLAAGRDLRIERQARKPPELRHIAGPVKLDGRWAWSNAAAALSDGGFPNRVSDDCGQFVCESTYWAALNHASGHGAGDAPQRLMFLHVPPLCEDWSATRIAAAMTAVMGSATAPA